MKIVQAQKLDSINDYDFVEKPKPMPASGEVVVKVFSCGMGYVDALVALGRYQVKPPTPFTPGQEIAGVIEALGSEVTELAIGDRVMATSFGGGLAEYVAVPAITVHKIPQCMSYAQAAGFNINYVTALHALKDRAGLQPGERLLVIGAAGGVGTAAVQIGKLLGAEVIATGSTENKRAFSRQNGAAYCLDVNPEGWRDRLKAIHENKKLDVVFDPVCGPLLELAFRSQAWGGRYLVVGFAGGPIAKLPVNLPLMKGASLVGVDVRQFFIYQSALALRHIGQLLSWVDDGRLSPPVGSRFNFASYAEAMQFAMSGKGHGKTIIDVIEEGAQ